MLLEVDSKDALVNNFAGILNNNNRIIEGYAKTAKSLAKMITKKIK